MTIYNSSNALASIVLKTLDSTSISDQLSDEASGNQVGWHDVSLAKDSKIESEALRNHVRKSLLPESVSPFIWSGSSSTGVQIKPLSTTEIPLQICVFSPGTYDLSNYVLNWNLQPVKDHENVGERIQSSGTSLGYPYYLTVLPSDWFWFVCLALLFLGVTEGGPPCSYFCKFGMYIIPSMYLLLLFFSQNRNRKKKELVMY